MAIGSLLIFAGALIIAAGFPGPSIAALIGRVLARGPREVLPFLAAMWIGEATWLSFAVWGLSAIAQTFHAVFVGIKWIGVAYLLFIAWKMWNAPSHLDASTTSAHVTPVKMFATGLAVTFGNPKIMLFYMALLPTIVDLRHLSLLGWVELTTILILVLIIIDGAWVLLAGRARLFIKSRQAIKIANRCSAGMMAGAAATIATR